ANASFVRGQAGTFTITSSAYPAATYTLTGALPAGVSFDPSTATLSGTPANDTSGNYPLAVTASNGVGNPVTQFFVLSVKPFAFTSSNLTAFAVGQSSAFQVSATGSLPAVYSLTGVLPNGVTFSPSGLLSGTPAAGTGGTYYLTITVTD